MTTNDTTATKQVRPSKIICVGRNYAAHAKELGNDVPERPLIFFKPPSAVIDNGDAIVLHPDSQRIEHEGEIGVVIATRARNVSEGEAMQHVRGYVALNDVTARDLQKSDGQWTRAKGFDTFCPIGSEVPASDVRWEDLTVECLVNGVSRQQGRATDMVFGVPYLVAYISRVLTLEPGDVIATGTPEGVGPLQDGDLVEVRVGAWSSVSNPVRKADFT